MAETESAILGGGCFWCLEAVFKELRGVASVRSGYAGGSVERPGYREVCGGRTGHAEVVEVRFDPAQISFEDLLRVFFTIHDPTTRDRQGNDVGTQYRSAIFFQSPGQEQAARTVMAEVTHEKLWDGTLTTEVAPLATFWPAEAEHDDYFARNPGSGYCRVVVAPKVVKFRKQHAARLRAQAA